MSNCAVTNCGNKVSLVKGTGIKFHKFPVIPSLRKEWLLRCQRDDNFNLDRAAVCSKHFTDDDYWRDLKSELLNLPSKRILKKNAVPSINVPPLPWEKPHRLRTPSCCLWHISSCLEQNGTDEVDFYQFPVRNGDVLEEWLNFTRCPPAADVSKLRLCSRHFKLSDFELFGERITLKDDAIPTLLPPVCVTLLETDNLSNFSADSDSLLETGESELDPASMYLLVPASGAVTLPHQFELALNGLPTGSHKVVPEEVQRDVIGSALEETILDDETLTQLLSSATSEGMWDTQTASLQSIAAGVGESKQATVHKPDFENKNAETSEEIDPFEVLNEVLNDVSFQVEDSQPQEGGFQPQEEVFNLQESDSKPQEGGFQLGEGSSQRQGENFQLQEENSQLLEKDCQSQEQPEREDSLYQEEDSQHQEEDCQPQSYVKLSEYEEQLLENVRRLLCRVCGRSHEELLPIFSENEEDDDELTLVKKIEMYLPLQIERKDDLPPNLCVRCHYFVESWHELHVSCVAADSVLQKMLYKKDMVLIHTMLEGEGSERESMASEESQHDDHRSEAENIQVDDYNPTEGVFKLATSQSSRAVVEESDQDYFEMDDSPGKENEKRYIENDYEHFNKYQNESLQSTLQISSFEFNHRSLGRKLPDLKCSYCQETFRLKGMYERHVYECALEPTMCHQCGKAINRRCDLQHHMKTHVPKTPKSYVCDKCGKELSSQTGLRVHMTSRYCGARTPVGVCEYCCKVFFCRSSLSKHIEIHKNRFMKKCLKFKFEPNGDETYICPICKESFQNTFSLIVHLNVPKKVQCVLCKKWLLNERLSLLHTCKSFLCNYCGKRFRLLNNMQAHKRTHTGAKPFSCRQCGDKFVSASHLQRHRVIHQPPTFACDTCGKRFRRKESLVSHMEIHSTCRKNCSFCFKEYSTNQTLSVHIKKCHNRINFSLS